MKLTDQVHAMIQDCPLPIAGDSAQTAKRILDILEVLNNAVISLECQIDRISEGNYTP